ncbi:hypothetical protein RCG19_03860 [Neobacillus sp. OS1-2]|uniref:hypothetical protein n=1 Tax=Neobacillus sp. OS1-2 TaxID=3070680 RepID=UPI0027E09781|nr:hypothetical protein [Neobacillus sp. OS1-2]WML40834.1 hypothetical protein RCG19_03860 [Neobacillus sp. OS1-2]
MEKRDPNNKYSFEYDEQGLNEVSEQIMNSYNSGFMGEGTALADSEDYAAAED